LIGYKGEQLVMLAWVGFNQFLLSFILYLRSNISGMLMFITDSFLSVLDRLLMILICAVLLWGNLTGGVFKIEWFVYAQTTAYITTVIIAMAIVMRKAKFKRLSWNRNFFLVILKKSLPFAILFLLMAVYNRVDTVYLERLIEGDEGERQVGIYAHGFRLLDAVNQFAWLTAVLLLPIYSRMIKMREDLNKMVRLPFSLLFTTAIIVVAASYFYSTEIMEWLYPKGSMESESEFALKLQQSARVYGILMFGFLGSAAMYVYSTLLTANGNLKQLNLIALSGIILNFAVNMLLIPRLEATGAAIASVITQIITSGAYMILAHHLLKLKVDFRFFLTIGFFVILVTGFNYFSKELAFHWLISFSVMLAACILAAFILKLINIGEIYRLVKEKSAG
jgi:O-antigen/teichoic acid export membrane protein